MQKRILLIDGDQDSRTSTASMLRLGGYEVYEATEGKAGLETAMQEIPDLIICEMEMDGLDGPGVLHVLGKNPETASIPFIFQSNGNSLEDIRNGMNLGADDYLSKPFNSTDLLNVIEIRMRKRESLNGNADPDNETVEEVFKQTKPIREIQTLMDGRIHRVMKRKEMIYADGQIPADIFYVQSGMVKTYKINKDGKELITGLYREGSFIGYLPVLRMTSYTENAEVLSDAEIGFISKQDFLKLLYKNNEAATRFIQLLTRQIAETENRMLTIAYDSVRQKVAQALLTVGKYNEEITKPFRIARRDLSGLIGTATESLNRTLADFKDEGLININPEGIQILNPIKLERMR